MGATAELVRRLAELYNAGSPEDYGTDRFLQLYADDVDWVEAPTAFMPQGRAGDIRALREALALSRSLFRDRRIVVDEIVENGDRAVWMGTWRATIGVDGLPFPIGTTIEVSLAMLIEVRGGLIVRQHDFPANPVISK